MPLLLAGGCNNGSDDSANLGDSTPASSFDGEVARTWMNLLYTLVKTNGTAAVLNDGLTPPPASRLYAYAGIGLYESCVRGMSDHNSLSGQVGAAAGNALVVPEPTENAPYHWPSVANRCMSVLTASFFNTANFDNPALVDTTEAGLAAQIETGVDAAVVARSITYGEEIAAAIIAWAATDGFVAGNNNWCGFTAPVVSGAWVGTGIGLLPCWGSLRTFAVADSDECAPVAPPTFSTSTTSEWYAEALQVYGVTGDAGASLSVDQAAIANFWADGANATGTPPGHWVGIVGVVTSQPSYDSLDIAAEAYARVGIAVADAFITCWQEKYDRYLQRPVTYIKTTVPIDAAWDPLLATPNFPTYPSGHSTQSGAAAAVLTDMFGPIAFTDTTHTDLDPELAYTDRSFANFLEAANEAAVSRLYGGIHYAFDNFGGFNSGVCVGSLVDSRLDFLK